MVSIVSMHIMILISEFLDFLFLEVLNYARIGNHSEISHAENSYFYFIVDYEKAYKRIGLK